MGDLRRIVGSQVQLTENGANDKIQFAPGEAEDVKSVKIDAVERRLTNLIPKQLRGPFEKETRYLSRSWEPSCNHLSGSKTVGSGNISGLRCTIVAP